jgi:hypothetical protein
MGNAIQRLQPGNALCPASRHPQVGILVNEYVFVKDLMMADQRVALRPFIRRVK